MFWLKYNIPYKAADMKKIVKCPWCGETVAPDVRLLTKEFGEVKERSCPRCGKVLSAYLVAAGNFLPEIRTFPEDPA